MATVSLIDPYSQQAEEIARRKRMAQALQESGSQVLDMPTTPGVAISPYAGLAKILESGLGAYQEKKARDDYTKLQNEYRTNYNTQLGEMARLISAPEIKGVAGTNEIPYEPAQTEKIYGTKLAPVKGTGFGSGMLMPDQVIGEKVIKPEVPYQAAVAPVQGQPAGYISAADLQKIDIPEVKQLLMAKYLKQFEPEQVTLGENQRLLQRTGGGDFKEVVGAAKTAKAAEPKWEKGQKTVDGKTLYGWYDLTAANYKDSFREGAVPPAGNTKLVEVTRGGKVYLENPEIADAAARQAAAIEKEAVPVKKIRLDVTAEDGSIKTLLLDETDPRFAEGFATKGPEYVSITEVNPKGETVVRQVKKGDPILKTGVVKPLEGFFGQLQALGVPIGDWKNNPALAEMVNRYFVKGVGGADVESVAGYDLQKMKVLAELGYQGIKVPQAVLDKLNIRATPGLLGSAATNALPLPADRDKKKLINGQTYQTDQGPAKWDAALGQFVN
jgi:hypothetical protein